MRFSLRIDEPHTPRRGTPPLIRAFILPGAIPIRQRLQNPQFLVAFVFYHPVIQLLSLYSNLVGKKCLTDVGTEGNGRSSSPSNSLQSEELLGVATENGSAFRLADLGPGYLD